MPYPDDLSDLLPLLPGTSLTRRLPIFGHEILVEIRRLLDDKYRLFVYDQHDGQLQKRFGADGLVSEKEVEILWKEFLYERNSIFTRDGAAHSRP